VGPSFSIWLAEVLKVYLLGPGHEARNRIARDGSLCFYGWGVGGGEEIGISGDGIDIIWGWVVACGT